MKIVHLCLSSVFIDNYSYQENMLPKYHKLSGNEVTVIASLITFDTFGKYTLLNESSIKIDNAGFKVIRLEYLKPFTNLTRFLRVYNKLSYYLGNEKPDILFIHDFSFFDIIRVVKYVKKNPNVRVYVDCHTDFINSGKTWISKNIFHKIIWRKIAGLISPYVQVFYGVTPLRCDFLIDTYGINPKKVKLLLMGVDDFLLKEKDKIMIKNQFLTKYKIPNNKFLIITGGKIDYNKNIDLVINSIINLNNPNIQLLIFGTLTKECESEYLHLMNSNSIIFLGWLSPEQILEYMMISDLVVFPGTHSVLWEQAVGLGKPCIFKYWEGMTHIDIGGNCKFLYTDTINEIQQIIANLMNSANDFETMKNAALNPLINNFTYSSISKASIS